MKSKTGDLHALTRDTEILDPGSGNADAAADTLDINDPAAATVEIADPDSKRHIVGGRSLPGSASAAGGYHILRKIGEGGMGIVYEAEQQHPRRLVALKVIRGGVYAGDYHVKMFEREIQALARLKHPGIVSIYEAGRFDDGQVFFAMELLQGRSLMEFVELKEISERKPLSLEDKLAFFSRICEIVSYAHQRGVIHRDLKPQNIFVSDDSATNDVTDSVPGAADVKILDFGLARITDPDQAGATDVSQIGHVKGTLNYMSPEQLTGNPADVDVRSDIYALGVILYEMLSGRLPYELRKASVPEAMRIISQQPPEPLRRAMTASISAGRSGVSRVDADVETIVMKALEKEPDRRYQSVAAMLDDVERFLRNQPILARPPSAFYQFRKLVTRHKAASASLAGLFLMLLAFGAVMVAQNSRITNERDKARMAQQTAEDQGFRAEEALEREQEQRRLAEKNLALAEEQQKAAEQEKQRAEEARKSEQEQRLIAERSLKAAQTERLRAEQQTALAEKQEGVAREQKTLAEQRQLEAESQRALVEEREETNRRLLYTSQMNLAHQAWEKSNVTMVEELLQNHVPKLGQADLREFEWYYLWNLANQNRWTFPVSARIVNGGFSRDGKLFIVSTLDNSPDPDRRKPPMTIFLDAETGVETERIEGHFFLAQTRDGKLLTTQGDKDGQIKVLDIESNEARPTKITDYWKSSGQFSPDGGLVATVQGQTVEVRDIYSGNLTVSFPWRLENAVGASVSDWSPDGKIILLNCLDRNTWLIGTILFDATTGKPALSGLGAKISNVSFSADATTIAFVEGGDLKVVDLKTMREKVVFKDHGRSDAVSPLLRLQFSPDGKQLAVGRGSTVDVYDLEKKLRLSTIKAHGEFLRLFVFSPRGGELVTVGFDQKVKLWRLPYSDDSVFIDSSVRYNLSPDGRILATGSREGDIRLWDIASGQGLGVLANREVEARELLIPPGSNPIPEPKPIAGSTVLTFSPDGRKLARLARDGVVDFWDVTSRRRVAVSLPGTESYAFQSEPNIVAVVSRAGRTTLWNVESRQPVSSFELTEEGEAKPKAFAWSYGGKVLAFSLANRVRLLEPATGKKRTADLMFPESPHVLNLSSDGSMLSLSVGRSARIVDTYTGREVRVQLTIDGTVGSHEFSPSGEILAVGVGGLTSKLVVLVDTRSGKQIGVLRGHLGLVASMKFSRDGKRLVTKSVDNTVKIWDIASQQLLISLQTEDYFPQFTPDGRTLVTSGQAGTHLWRGATDAEIAARN